MERDIQELYSRIDGLEVEIDKLRDYVEQLEKRLDGLSRVCNENSPGFEGY